MPKIYSPAFLEGFEQPCLAMEFIPGQTLTTFLLDTTIPLDHKKDIISRFCREMARRHERALEQQEIRLLLFHPNMSRILVLDDRLVYLDFEVMYTPDYDVKRIASKEIGGFLYSLARCVPRQQLHPLMECFIKAYPGKARMAFVLEEMRRFGTVPVYGWLKRFPFMFLFYSKYRKTVTFLKEFDVYTASQGIS